MTRDEALIRAALEMAATIAAAQMAPISGTPYAAGGWVVSEVPRAIRAIDPAEVLAGLRGFAEFAPDAVARLTKLADQLDRNAINAERMVALLQPEFDAFEARTGHNVYVVRDYVDHQNAAKRQRQEALDIRAALAAMESEK